MNFSTHEVAERLDFGFRAGAFPGAVAFWGSPRNEPSRVAVGLRGRSRNAVPATFDLSYDLASLTKLLATTSLALILVQKGLLDLHQPVVDGPLGRQLPASLTQSRPWRLITPEHLLAHQSGLRPWLAIHRLPKLALEQRREAVLRAIWHHSALEPGSQEPGRRTIYSDLNFMVLGFLMETISGQSLDRFFEQEVAGPLGLTRLSYRPLCGPLAPTEDGFRWGGPVGHPEAGYRGPTPLGRVHDDNTAWLGGISGHAGLFGPAEEVWRLAAEWDRAWSGGRSLIFQRETLTDFIRPRPTREDGGRCLGFNVKSREAALAESCFSSATVGHTGYTGVSLWWDPAQDFLWLFLTNRVHPRAVNPAWSPALYQAGPRLFRHYEDQRPHQ